MLNRAFTNRMKKLLETRRAALLPARMNNVRDESEMLAERESDLLDTGAVRTAAIVLGRLAEAELEEILKIDAALARMAKGDWGICETCGEAIGHARLSAIPETARCVDCESAKTFAGA